MADVKINLEATHKDFLAALTQSADAARKLIAVMQSTAEGHKTLSAEATAAAKKSAEEELKATKTILAAKALILREAQALAAQQKQIDAGVAASAKQAAAAQLSAATQGRGTFSQMTEAAKGHFAEVRASEAALSATSKQASRDRQKAAQELATQARGVYEQMTTAAKGHFAEVRAAQAATGTAAKLAAREQQQSLHATATQGKGTYEEMSRAAKGHFAFVKQQTKELTAQNKKLAESHTVTASAIGLAVQAYNLLIAAVLKVVSLAANSFKRLLTDIDDFKKGTIGTAAAITNLADPTLRFGKTWNQVFQQNLKQTEGVFIELEKLAARYFASSIDLQLAYNAFAQRGVVLRRTELEQLAQLTDLILLLTQGQQSSIQVQEEIRSLVNGTLRPTAQLGQLIKAFGLDLKDVAAQIKTTQSLKPLEGVLRGAKEATTEIQKTYQASLNGIQTLLLQLERVGGAALFGNVVAAIQKFTSFIQANQSIVVRVFSVVGTAAAKAVEFVEKFIEKLFKANGTAGDSVTPFLQLAATIITVGEAIGKVLEVIALFIAKLPVAISDAIHEFSKIKTALAEGEKLASGDSSQGFFTNAVKGSGKFLSDTFTANKAIREIGETTQATTGALGKLGSHLGTAFEGIFGTDFVALFKSNLKRITDETNSALKNVKALTTGAVGSFVGTRIPFKEGEDERTEREQAKKAVFELQRVVDRTKRNEQSATVIADLGLELAALRRELALVEQGFKTVGLEAITGFDSVEIQIANFRTKFAEALAVGGAIDFTELQAGVSEASGSIQRRQLANLELQLAKTKNAFKEFADDLNGNTQEAIVNATQELARDVERLKNEAAHSLENLRKDGEQTIKIIERQLAITRQLQNPATAQKTKDVLQEGLGTATVSLAQTEHEILAVRDAMRAVEQQARSAPDFKAYLERSNIKALETELSGLFNRARGFREEIALLAPVIQAKSTAQITALVERLTGDLTTAQDTLFAGLQNQVQANQKLQETITSKEQLIALETQKLKEAELFRLASGRKNILEQELRIQQAILDIQTKGIKAAESQTLLVAARVAKTQAQLPRTSTEQALSGISEEREAFNKQVAEEQTTLNVRTEAIAKLSITNIAAAASAYVYVDAAQAELDQRILTADAAFKSAENLARLQLAVQGVGTAATSAANGLFDALLQSFEGKKPELVRLFKSVSDQLFKDAMKGFVESLSKTLSTAFNNLAGKIPGNMAGTLGPAFLAGFALIASFVLGQLLSGDNSSASPGSASVGISSTEQVRGLIGGETQIPIGLIGESLQDALVPTNLLLSRIAAGVDRLSFGGIDPAVIEQTISASISDALQIQLSAT